MIFQFESNTHYVHAHLIHWLGASLIFRRGRGRDVKRSCFPLWSFITPLSPYPLRIAVLEEGTVHRCRNISALGQFLTHPTLTIETKWSGLHEQMTSHFQKELFIYLEGGSYSKDEATVFLLPPCSFYGPKKVHTYLRKGYNVSLHCWVLILLLCY